LYLEKINNIITLLKKDRRKLLNFIDFINRYILFDKSVIGKDRIFTWEHFLMSFVVILFYSLLFFLVFKKKNEAKKLTFLHIMCWIMLGIEIFRVVWNVVLRYEGRYNFIQNVLMAERFDLCNQVTILLPIFVLTKSKKFYESFLCLAILGGGTILLYPKWVFFDYAGLHLMSILSMFSHGMLVFISILMLNLKMVELNEKYWHRILIGFALILFIAIGMSVLLDGPRTNYIETKSSTFPLIKEIPWPYYMLFQFSLMAEGLILIYCCLIFVTNKIYKQKNKWLLLFIVNMILIVITVILTLIVVSLQ
jgi:hypothetical protein